MDETQIVGFTTSTANLIVAQLSSVFYSAFKSVFLSFWPQLLLFALVFFGYKTLLLFLEFEHDDDKTNAKTIAAMQRQRDVDEFHATHYGEDELEDDEDSFYD